MKKYVLFIIVALAFMACEKTIFVGGTVTDFQSRDSIEGLEMGLYAATPEFDYEDKRWSELELIAMGTSNSDGFFSMEIDEKTDVNQMFYFPLPPTDTLSVNARYRYSSSYETEFLNPDYGKDNEFRLERSSLVQVKLTNFTQHEIEMRFADGAVRIYSLDFSAYLSYQKLLSGINHKLDFYEVVYVNDDTYETQLEYLGSISRFIKTQLPENRDKVKWHMPLQTIEIDYNTLEK